MRALMLGLALTVALTEQAMACGAGKMTRGTAPVYVPPLAVALDSHQLDAILPESDRAKVRVLRAEIDELVKAQKDDEARKVEEEAMAILGYRKAWAPCGTGSFLWMIAATPAPRTAAARRREFARGTR